MKPSEAIKIIKRLIGTVELGYKAAGPLTDRGDYPETKALKLAISALEKQEQDRWIPVTERPPEEEGNYLVTTYVCGEKAVEESLFLLNINGDAFWTAQNVIAWKEKPEPYQEEEA